MKQNLIRKKSEGEKLFLTLFYLGVILFALPLWAENPSAMTAAPESKAQNQSLDEVNKELSNPISSIWSITFQQNNYLLDIEGKKAAGD